MNKVETFRKIVNDMADLYEKKNENYGDSFGKLYRDLGPIAGLVPLHNKLDRLTHLICGNKTGDFESIEDSFKDLACYAIMNLIEMEAKQAEKLSGATREKAKQVTRPTKIKITYPDGHVEEVKDTIYSPKTVLLSTTDHSVVKEAK